MGRYKCAYECETPSDPDVKFFKFPLYNPRRLKKWLVNMKWKDWTPSRFSVLCSNHFEEQCIDRTGKCVKLREDAVPTIFSAPDSTQKRKAPINLRSKRQKPSSVKASQTGPAQSQTKTPATGKRSVQNKEPGPTEEEPAGDKEPKKSNDKWRIIVDEGLMEIESFPHFFHGDYCVPQQDIQLTPDDDVSVPIYPRSKRQKPSSVKASQMGRAQSQTKTPATGKRSVQNKEPGPTEEEPAGDKEPKKSNDKWRIIVDEGLMKIESFPHFFHGDYCVPQDIQWAPDDDVSQTECADPENMIEVKEPWEWLGLDVRGPLPQTPNGHKYILTVTDFCSKWVEAVPMQSCLPSHVAKHIVDIIGHFGYPLRILSRLPHDIVHKINRELKDQLKVTIALVIYHHQTGTVDLITQQLIDRMVSDLIEEHAADWDVYLPAKVFSLCFKEHSKTKERPFSVLCCKGLEPVQSPRGLDFAYSRIQESVFVIR